MMEAEGPTVLLGVTGSVAAFRAIDLASRLTQGGYRVDVVLTEAALQFVRPLSFEAVTHRPAYTDESPGTLGGRAIHVELGERARLVVVAPATADLIGRYAGGLASDLLSAVLLASAAPVLLAPAMNARMWEHPAVRRNVVLLRRRGVHFLGPESGLLSCGIEGPGRLWPVDRLQAAIEELLAPAPPSGNVARSLEEELAAQRRQSFSLRDEYGKGVSGMPKQKKAAKKPAVKKEEENSRKEKGGSAKKK